MRRFIGFFLSLFILLTFVLVSCVVSPKEVNVIYLPDTNWADTSGDTYNSNTTGVYTSLVWHDEFNGVDYSSANPANWTNDIGNGSSGWGNNEVEYYLPQCGYIYKGTLVIKAQVTSYGGQNYISARLKTQGLQSWTYGKVVARMQLPAGQGFWPAFWMLGTNNTSAGWPACGENDIMENKGTQPTICGSTLIFNTNSGPVYDSQPYPLGSGQFNTSYHVFELVWYTNYMKYYVDGNLVINITSNNVVALGGSWTNFNKPFFIILNLAIGGPLTGYTGNLPPNNSAFPGYMFVDWVRVYQ